MPGEGGRMNGSVLYKSNLISSLFYCHCIHFGFGR